MNKIYKLAQYFNANKTHQQPAPQQKDDIERGAIAGTLGWTRVSLLKASKATGKNVLEHFNDSLKYYVNPWPLPENMGLHDSISRPLKESANYLTQTIKVLSSGKPMSLKEKKIALNYTVGAYRILKDYKYPIKSRTKLLAAMGKSIGKLNKGLPRNGNIVI
jgi:hypothetical protein